MTKTEPEYYIKKMDTHWAIEYVEKDYDGEKVRVANVKNWLYKNGKNGGDTAKLFLEALETERDFGLSPRQLLSQRDSMIEALREAESAMFHVLSDGGFNTGADRDAMREAITKCRFAIVESAKTSKEGV